MDNKNEVKARLRTTVLLALLALVAISAASYAWFSIADSTKLRSIGVDITSGLNLRFDLDPHVSFAEYNKTLTFEQILNRVLNEKGYNMYEDVMEPATTSDCQTFYFEDGTMVDPNSGAYWEFTLHFMSSEDMLVHLSSIGAKDEQGNYTLNGTSINSSYANFAPAMRVGFTVVEDEKINVYDPGMTGSVTYYGNIKYFGLPSSENMVYNEDNSLFYIQKDTDKTVIVHVWMEGTDEYCNDSLQGSDFSILLRFVGTDLNNQPLD